MVFWYINKDIMNNVARRHKTVDNYEVKSYTEKYLKATIEMQMDDQASEWSLDIAKTLKVAFYAMKKTNVPKDKMHKFDKLVEFYIYDMSCYDGVARIQMAICKATNDLINTFTEHSAYIEDYEVDDKSLFSSTEEREKVLGKDKTYQENREETIKEIMKIVAEKEREHNKEIAKETILNTYEIAENAELTEEQTILLYDAAMINLKTNRKAANVAIQESWYKAVVDSINKNTEHTAELYFSPGSDIEKTSVITLDGEKIKFHPEDMDWFEKENELVLERMIPDTYETVEKNIIHNQKYKEIINNTLDFSFKIANATGLNEERFDEINEEVLEFIKYDKTSDFHTLIQTAYATATSNAINKCQNSKKKYIC